MRRARNVEQRVQEVLTKYRLKVNERTLGRFLASVRSVAHDLNDELFELLVLDNLTIGESYFFRDRKVFSHIKDLLKGRDFWNVLSIGCSKGEEVYSFAIAAVESGVRYRILGVDISPHRIGEASRGCYAFWSLRFLDDEEIGRYFDKNGNRFCVKETYRTGVTFLSGDFLELDVSTYGPFDIVFARRVLLYTDNEEKFVGKILEVLKDDGFLITGIGEYFPILYKFFEPSENVPGVYRKFRRPHLRSEAPSKISRPNANGLRDTLSRLNSEHTSHPLWGFTVEDEVKIVEAHIREGRFGQAYERLKGLTFRNPTKYIVWKYKTLAELELGLFDEADRSIKKALFLNSCDDEIWQLKHMLELRRGKR